MTHWAKRMLPAALVLGVLLSATGCTMRLTDFTTISTKNIRLNVDKGKRVEGSDCGMFAPSMKVAIDRAIESAGDPNGDMLIDGVLSVSDYIFVKCFRVEGNIVATKTARPLSSGDEPGRVLIPLAAR